MPTRWFVGCDHAGLGLKRALVTMLRGLGDQVDDLGTSEETSVDYPDYGAAVGRAVVAAGADARGLVVCGTGIGISIAANKVPGVRCALVHDSYTAQQARAHNDANVIALGARVVGAGVAEAAVRAFRDGGFEGGRHGARVGKLDALLPVGAGGERAAPGAR
ncbi:MAG: ribose 5-phosphate isomerase B [Kofleriaceae bacterium]|jgi:ribose 5-phosphate isomerase B|nr:ribose 5-phosphate isomerase B [Kofleriaceae bacterium]